ncbi:MAG: hypothetical protein QOE54_724 [Streptosporangiaceae bacterium]|jgi:hypothetical protein|nr:hypothetical protein [Streptosporangiaceae bacterium]MDX6428358.1 hypothetical protein [Streptosporangiaceae bacterium]
MTDPFDEYGEILRRALHAEADSVMPAPDGLERIRERIGDRHRAPMAGPSRPWRLRRGWFSESWARPLLAAGAAAFVALLAVSAPPAIHGITSAGDRGPAAHDTPRHGGEPGGGTSNGRQYPPYPGVQTIPRPTIAVTPTPTPASGTPSCPVTSPAVKARTSARVTPPVSLGKHVTASPTCPKPPVTPTPTPAPSTPQVSQPATPSVPPQTDPPPQQPAP